MYHQWVIITEALMQSHDFTVVVGCREDIFLKPFLYRTNDYFVNWFVKILK